jgi:hypothetical protein
MTPAVYVIDDKGEATHAYYYCGVDCRMQHMIELSKTDKIVLDALSEPDENMQADALCDQCHKPLAGLVTLLCLTCDTLHEHTRTRNRQSWRCPECKSLLVPF